MTTALVSLTLPLGGLACASARPAAARTVTVADRTGPDWARLADRVPTPVLQWTTCDKTDQCASAELPLSYRHPRGGKIKVALLRVPARDPRHVLGTIFVNPGGPGDSARGFAALLPQAVPGAILDRFDIVGVDPRGVGGSTPLRCFRIRARQNRVDAPFAATPFPYTRAQERSWIGAARALGRACSTTGRRIASAMSSTDDAMDMDVLRRAVGDRKLTYFGESYGSYLGLVYANMFPGRIRALAIDGIVDPQALAGTRATADVPVFDRMGSAAGSYRALHELLELCQRAGRPRCSFASAHTPARFARLAAALRARPLRLAAPGIKTISFTYPDLVADTEHWMHDPAGYRGLFAELTDLERLSAPGGAGSHRAALTRALLRLRAQVQGPPGLDNQAQSGQGCADTLSAANPASWPRAAAAADRRAPYFGAFYAWVSLPCARDTWTVRDPDVYRGPFDRRTDAPVLVVGARWDPATSYDSAVKVARMLPNSRLISSDNWGHESAGTSACVDNALFGYLLRPLAPAPKVMHCRGDVQPFAPSPSGR
ncbi:MAG TPA: alpha/beta hydrolase [Streptosporangiaceae bacterium]|nr:alpha/beta hydrolase [Streptosporangiaceae bacterium]